MSKKEKAEVTKGTEERKILKVTDFDEIEVAGESELASLDEVLASFADPSTGEVDNSSEWTPTIVGSEYFWPAAAGLAIRGNLIGVEERKTSLFVVDPDNPNGPKKQVTARYYTIELTAPCLAIRSADVVPGQPLPKPVQCMPGQHVAVLERTVLRRLENDIGCEVIIVCDGLGKTKAGLKLWKFRSWRRAKVEVLSETPQLTAGE
jgi:hypothetical protein